MKNQILTFGLLILCLPGFTPALAQDAAKTFTVQDGSFPWFDRVNQWELANVPSSLKGGGPLPQGACASRSLEIPGNPKSITLGVHANDAARFKDKFQTAKQTGEQINVKNPSGVTLIYDVFTFPDPPAKIDGAGVFAAGLLLLKIEGTGTASGSTPPPTATPGSIAPVATKPFELVEREKLHVYLLMGQSNMVGRDTTGLNSQIEDLRIGCLSIDNKHWVIAREPMHAGGSGIGPGIQFAEEMLKTGAGIKIALVPCAVGGTPLSRWVKGADLYENAVKRAKIAMGSGVLKGVLWHQGESDGMKAEDAGTYETRLSQMFRDLRKDLGIADLPIAVGQLGDFVNEPHVSTVRAAIEQMPASVPNVGFVSSKALPDKGDHLHFSADAQKEFGHRYADAMRKLQSGTASTPNGL